MRARSYAFAIVLQHEAVETVSRLIRVNLDGQVDFLAGMRVQQMQTELDEALTSGNMLLPSFLDP
jgi:hypothetical protein